MFLRLRNISASVRYGRSYHKVRGVLRLNANWGDGRESSCRNYRATISFPRSQFARESSEFISDCQSLRQLQYLRAIRIIFLSLLRRSVKHSIRTYGCRLVSSFLRILVRRVPTEITRRNHLHDQTSQTRRQSIRANKLDVYLTNIKFSDRLHEIE